MYSKVQGSEPPQLSVKKKTVWLYNILQLYYSVHQWYYLMLHNYESKCYLLKAVVIQKKKNNAEPTKT